MPYFGLDFCRLQAVVFIELKMDDKILGL